MCECQQQNWCRFFEETQGGKFPPSYHAPGCREYKPIKFIVATLDNVNCVVPASEFFIKDYIDDPINPDNFVFTEIMLTQDQFDNMEEFSGF